MQLLRRIYKSGDEIANLEFRTSPCWRIIVILNKAFIFCLPKRCSRSRIHLKKCGYGSRLRLPVPTSKKIGSGSGAALKVADPGGSGSATLLCEQCCGTVAGLFFAGAGEKAPGWAVAVWLRGTVVEK